MRNLIIVLLATISGVCFAGQTEVELPRFFDGGNLASNLRKAELAIIEQHPEIALEGLRIEELRYTAKPQSNNACTLVYVIVDTEKLEDQSTEQLNKTLRTAEVINITLLEDGTVQSLTKGTTSSIHSTSKEDNKGEHLPTRDRV